MTACRAAIFLLAFGQKSHELALKTTIIESSLFGGTASDATLKLRVGGNGAEGPARMPGEHGA